MIFRDGVRELQKDVQILGPLRTLWLGSIALSPVKARKDSLRVWGLQMRVFTIEKPTGIFLEDEEPGSPRSNRAGRPQSRKSICVSCSHCGKKKHLN